MRQEDRGLKTKKRIEELKQRERLTTKLIYPSTQEY